ncbi:hypothetical protein PDG61_21255 [Mycolicibacterium sp. BiH015]|uniref:hypothetical protein n=1 Tax=Mycolicibacterium sp. BiH015 TaxID=3018808 RepID=UPI0022E3E2DA|nr:hypothetical protein [Mycolicibacterium sp. BiH015]MDA2893457.1 hypothetical protein [Mycolicibacterium sp. BiH015]
MLSSNGDAGVGMDEPGVLMGAELRAGCARWRYEGPVAGVPPHRRARHEENR